MKDVRDYIQSGILEAYIAGELTIEQGYAVEEMARLHDSVRLRLDELSWDLERQARASEVKPPGHIKAVVMASIDYMRRKSEGEAMSGPPPIHEGSQVSDYEPWLQQKAFKDPLTVDGMYIRFMYQSHQLTAAVVWLQDSITETHYREIEKFFIVQGSCQVSIGEATHHLKAGDIMTIGAGMKHSAITTSNIPCKFIVQRIPA